jgi:hypothetical protein
MLGSVAAGEGISRRAEEQLELCDAEPCCVVASAAPGGGPDEADEQFARARDDSEKPPPARTASPGRP